MTSSASLSICGDVERPARLAPAEPRALMDAELTAASRAVGVGLLSEHQIGGPDRGHPSAAAGDRGGDCARPAQPLGNHQDRSHPTTSPAG